LDDPNSTSDIESDATRYRTELFFSEVLPDRLSNLEEDAIVIIMQRLHERDVSGVALDREMGYTHVSFPMEYEPGLYVNAFTVNEQGNLSLGRSLMIKQPLFQRKTFSGVIGALRMANSHGPSVSRRMWSKQLSEIKGRLLTPGTISSGPRHAAGTSLSETGGSCGASHNSLH
jgi:hypothetical protein